jgi:hypothetical protein
VAFGEHLSRCLLFSEVEQSIGQACEHHQSILGRIDGARVGSHDGQLLELGLWLLVSLVFAFPLPLFWFFSLYLFFIAHLTRGLALVTSLAASITPLGKRRFSLVARLFRWMSRPLLPQLELWTMEQMDGPPQRATLLAPLRVDFVRDGWGWLERYDAVIATPPRVKCRRSSRRAR